MLWVLLAFWLGVVPLWPVAGARIWFLHLGVVLVLGLVTLPRVLRAPSLRVGFPALAIGLALLSLTLSVVLARPEASLSGLLTASLTGLAHGLFFLLCLVLLPGAEVPADSAEVRRARLALAGLLVLFVGGQLVLVLMEGQLGDPDNRPDGSLGNPNVLGTLVGSCALALVGLLRLRHWKLLALPVLLLPYLLLTRSRGALLATGVTLLLLAVHWRRRVLLIGLAVAAVLVLVVPNPLRDRVLALRAEHSYSRPFLWGSALERIADAPAGIGPGMNRYDFPRVAWDGAQPWLLHQRHSIGLTHNVFLTLTLEWGWLAGAALLALTLFTTRRLLGRGLHADDPLCLGAVLGASVLFFELQVDGIEQNPLAFSVFLLLLAAALARVTGAEPRGVRLPGRAAAAVLLVPLAVLASGLAWRTRDAVRLADANELVAAFESARAGSPAEQQSAPGLQAVRAGLQAAESVVPHDPDAARARFLFERGVVRALLDAGGADATPGLAREAQFAEARSEAFSALERARAANGLESELPYLGAQFALQLYRRAGRDTTDLAGYVRLMQVVLALDPLDVESRWELAQEAQRAGLTELAEAQCNEVFRLEPDHAYAWYALARLADAAGDKERSLYCYVRASEAQLNCQLKSEIPNPVSRTFYQRNADQVDLVQVWARIVELRRDLYFQEG